MKGISDLISLLNLKLIVVVLFSFSINDKAFLFSK